MAWAGRHFYVRAWKGLRHRTADMNTLIAIGTGAAFVYSVVATVAPDLFVSEGARPDVYYEAVIIIIALVLAGQRHGSASEDHDDACLAAAGEAATVDRARAAQWAGRGCADRRGAERRPGDCPARRTHSGGRRRHVRQRSRGRIDADRRIDAGGQAAWRSRDWRHDQHVGRAGHRGHQRRRLERAGAHRHVDEGSAGIAGADSTAGRPHLGGVCASGAVNCRSPPSRCG